MPLRPRSITCASCWQGTRGPRRRAVRSNNSAAVLRYCSCAWRSPRNPLVAHLSADAGPEAQQPFSKLSFHS
jgi:hypothetical protein